MTTPFDMAFGRLAVARGLVAGDAVRQAWQAMPPGAALKEELVRRGLLDPRAAAALEQHLLRLGPQALSSASGAVRTLAPDPGPGLRPSGRFDRAPPPGALDGTLRLGPGAAAGVEPLPPHAQPAPPPAWPRATGQLQVPPAAELTVRLGPGAAAGLAADDGGATLRLPPGAAARAAADDAASEATVRLGPGQAGPDSRPPTAAAATTHAAPRAAGLGATDAGLPEPGNLIAGRYEVVATLGKGGMGAVYRARDLRAPGAEVAVKVMLADADPDGTALARFRREAEAVARVDAHAGIVRVRDLGLHEGRLPFAAMDLVVGQDLHARVKARGGGLPLEDALRFTEKVARAIQHCHEKGVLHRDLKPANVMVRASDGEPLVMDFGLALVDSAQRLTRTGEAMGTPAYMSPEQAEGNKAEVDAGTDVYALGAILHELLTGKPPFEGDAVAILKQVFMDDPRPPTSLRKQLPADVDVICRKAMAKDKRKRYASAGALADDVARLARGEPIAARPPTWWEGYRWRLARRDRRTVLRTGAAVAALIVAGAVALAPRRRDEAVERLAGLLARPAAAGAPSPLDLALAGDPLGREGQPDGGPRLVEAVGRAAAAAPAEGPALLDGVAALASRAEAGAWPEDAPPWLDRARADAALARLAADERRAAGAGLRTLVGRAAFDPRAEDDRWRRLGPAGAEARLFAAARALGYRQPTDAAVPPGRAGWACDELAALADAPRPVAEAARQLRAAALVLLDAERRQRELAARQLQVPADAERPVPALEASKAAADSAALQAAAGAGLQALQRSLFRAAGEEALEGLRKTLGALSVRLRAVPAVTRKPTHFEAVRQSFLNLAPQVQRAAAAALGGEDQLAVRAFLRRRVGDAARDLVIEALVAAREGDVLRLAEPSLSVLQAADDVVGCSDAGSDADLSTEAQQARELRLKEALRWILLTALSGASTRKAPPSPKVLVLFPRCGALPRLDGLEGLAAWAGPTGPLGQLMAQEPSGDGYLIWVHVVRSLRETDERGDAATIERLVELLACALGPGDLPPELRAGRPPLVTPLSRDWTDWAAAWLHLLRLRRELVGDRPTRLEVVEEALAGLGRARGGLAARHPVRAIDLDGDLGGLLGRLRQGLASKDGGASARLTYSRGGVAVAPAPDAAWLAARRDDEVAAWDRVLAGARAAIVDAQRPRDEGAAQGVMDLAAGVDLERLVKVFVCEAARHRSMLAFEAGAPADGVALFEGTLAWLRERGLEGQVAVANAGIDLARARQGLAQALEAAGRPDDARAQLDAAAAGLEAVVARASAAAPADPKDRAAWHGRRSEARLVLARLRLGRGDRAAARAILAAARAGGDDAADQVAGWRELGAELDKP